MYCTLHVHFAWSTFDLFKLDSLPTMPTGSALRVKAARHIGERYHGGDRVGTLFDPDEMRGMMQKGYERAQAYFAASPPTDPFIT